MKPFTRYSKISLFILAMVLVFASLMHPSFAGETGKIIGRVIDNETGEGLPGANIVIVGTYMGASTDTEGDFLILNVPPGNYDIEASMLGYATQIYKNMVVKLDLTTKVSFKLPPEAIVGAEVVVTADAIMITRDMTATQANVSAEQIDNLPVIEFQDVVTLQAGVIQGRDGKLHLRGGRAEEVVYMVDGIPMTDVYSGEIATEVENASIQELQVISGTYNAEYGRALSGIINIVTKSIQEKYSGSFTFYAGDYNSSDKDIFPHTSNFEPSNALNLQFSLRGPVPLILNKKLRFLMDGRYFRDKGYIWGQRVFNPQDSSNVAFDTPKDYLIESTGDGSLVAMQPFEKQSMFGKLTYNFTPTLDFSASLLYSDVNERDWGREGSEFTPENEFHDFYRYMLNPDGSSKQYRTGYTFLADLNHVLNARTFYSIKFSTIYVKNKSYVYEDPFDPRYAHPQRLIPPLAAGNTFYTGGTDMWHSNRSTTTIGGKFDITSQVSKTHQIKTGLEYRNHKLDFVEFKLVPQTEGGDGVTGPQLRPFQTAILPRISPFHNQYEHNPTEFTVYIQDKMEFDFLIVNLGVRYDIFDPNAPIPTDLGDPGNPDKLKPASIKKQISPRLGVAYPISEQGVIHFSVGRFFQIPVYRALYTNSEFEVQIGRLVTIMGNANLEPEKTTSYEVGLQQQLSDNLAFDLTVFYKDIQDLLGTEIYQLTRGADRYAYYVNRDFGNARGLTFALTQRHSTWMAAAIDYTFQIAQGNASEPNASFIDRRANREPERRLVPLDWDQRHTLNASLTMSNKNTFNITLLGRYGSGLPYTPQFLNVRQAFENTARSPATLTFDLKTQYNIYIKRTRLSFFLNIFNLLDRRNETIVYGSTGRAGYNLEWRLSGQPKGVNTVEEFYLNRPHYFSPPRQILFGITVGL
jgi:outer membrane receptor protein involved in Fe transport